MVAFAQLLRYGQRREKAVFVVVWVNYAFAALISAAWGAWHLAGDAELSWTAAALGAASGTLYFTNMLWILLAYRYAGVGITVAIMSSSTVLPVVVSWLAWSDEMSPYKWLALGLVWAAIALMRPGRLLDKRLTWKADFVLLLAFLNAGLVGVSHKALSVYAPGQQPTYQMVLFLFSAVLSIAYAAIRRETHTRPAMLLGLPIGLANALTTAFMVLAIAALPAGVVFPISTACVISLNVILGRMLWTERIAPRQVAGLALAMVVAVLANV